MLEIYYLENGKIKRSGIRQLKKIKNKKLWIEALDITKEEAVQLKDVFNLHPVTEEDLHLKHGRIKIEEFPEYLFCSFNGITEQDSKVDLIILDFVIGKNYIISKHEKKIKSFERLKKEERVLKNLLERGPASIFHKLLDEEIDNFFPVLQNLDDDIERLDEKIAHKHSPRLLSKILDIKRRIVEIKKITYPQREKLSYLAKRDYKFIPKKDIPYFRNIYDHSIRVADTIENYRENIGNTFDAYMSSVANTQNDVMKVLSVIATIALPLTAISGIYGTNFTNLPGSKNPHGFWIMLIIMFGFALGMTWIFKKRKWF